MPNIQKRKLAAILFADIVGYTALMQSDEPQALVGLQKFQTALNGDGYGKYLEVLASYQSGDYANCIKILENDYDRVKKLFTDKYFLANVYAKAGVLEKAKEIVKKAIDQKTDEPMYYYQMAVLLEKDDQQAAKKYLDIALQFWADADPDFIPLQRANTLANQLAL